VRRLLAVVLLLAAACGEPSLTATEYRDLVVDRSAAYAEEAEGIRVNNLYQMERAVDDLVKELEGEALQAAAVEETAQRTAALFAGIADAVDRFVIDLAAMAPPDGLRDAHEEYVDALMLSIDGLDVTMDALAVASSFADIDAAIGGSTFNDSQHRVDAACRRLEGALADAGATANLQCRQE
jgi:hypothetical protein